MKLFRQRSQLDKILREYEVTHFLVLTKYLFRLTELSVAKETILLKWLYQINDNFEN